MDIRCHSPFQPFWFRSRDASGDFHDVVVIEATYELQDERTLRIACEQESVSVKDEYWGAPDETSVRQESDLAPFEPKADVVVIGDAYAPGGEPAESWPVQIWIDDHTHALRVSRPSDGRSRHISRTRCSTRSRSRRPPPSRPSRRPAGPRPTAPWISFTATRGAPSTAWCAWTSTSACSPGDPRPRLPGDQRDPRAHVSTDHRARG